MKVFWKIALIFNSVIVMVCAVEYVLWFAGVCEHKPNFDHAILFWLLSVVMCDLTNRGESS